MIIFNYLIFPGILFSVVIGLLAGWFDRKLTARLQYRVGPPWNQNFMDILKLFYKEAIVPTQGAVTFIMAPCVGLLGAGLAAMLVANAAINPAMSFNADLVLVMYLLLIPAVAMIIGASSSRNPLASIGASREMKLVTSYELPFILSILAIVIKCGWTLQLSGIADYQAVTSSNVFSFSGALAFLAALFCALAKLGFAPFEISEAEQEIMAGVFIEYSGWPLAVFKLMKASLLYTIPFLLIVLFFGANLTAGSLVIKYLLIVIVLVLLKNTNPRLRIDQAMKFFWGPATLAALAAVILAILGK